MSLLTAQEQAARQALRARQGAGARYDALGAPAEDLLMARRGSAYFARKLGELSDADLDGPSRQVGVARRLLVAEVGYHARLLAHQVAGAETPATLAEWQAQIALGATLPARALRSLIHHAAIHLDVVWRDLRSADWDRTLMLLDGTEITVRATPVLRARLLWQAALDLGNGGRWQDVPPDLRE
jgi:maleylpyruvate isomerase